MMSGWLRGRADPRTGPATTTTEKASKKLSFSSIFLESLLLYIALCEYKASTPLNLFFLGSTLAILAHKVARKNIIFCCYNNKSYDVAIVGDGC